MLDKNSNRGIERRGDLVRRVIWVCAQSVRPVTITIGFVFPVLEGILVNQMTSRWTATPPTEGRAEMIALGAVGVVHIWLLLVRVFGDNDLPHLVVRYQQREQQLEEAKSKSEQQSLMTSTFKNALEAAAVNQTALGVLMEAPRTPADLCREVLEPWCNLRSEVFWFDDGNALFNFAVYLKGESGKLELAYRVCDNRIVRTDRAWDIGDGHVGMCFARGKRLFSADAAVTDDILSTDRPEDVSYYRSLASAPIFVDHEKVGVFIVTSSVPSQMEKEIHMPIIELVATFLGAALQHARGE